MIVYGYKVPPKVKEALESFMMAGDAFTFRDLVTRARRIGVPFMAADRLCDRLIQRNRKQLTRSGREWRASATV